MAHLLVVMSLVAVALQGGLPRAQSVDADLRNALAIVSIVYPEIVGRDQHVTLTGLSQVRVDVRDVDTLVPGFVPRAQASVDVRFDGEGRLLELRADGPLVSGAKNTALRNRLRSTIRGQESGLREWLRELGAQYGPDSAPFFSRSAEDLRRLTGMPVTVQARGFQWRDSRTGEPDAGWVVVLSGVDASGAPASYAALLEPISGRVVRLARQE